jgi:NAD(P)-dependent dehydrogenase (short-subunit alcohol dehydrogenase family)
MSRLKNKTIIITGACGDVGQALTALCYSHGANLVLADINQTALDFAEQKYDSSRVQVIKVDVSQESENIAMVDCAIKHFGKIDGFVANAAISGKMSAIEDMNLEDFTSVLNVNLVGVWLGIKSVAKEIKKQGGSIVITSSVGGITGAPFVSNYVSSKHGVVGLMRSLSLEMGDNNVRVNCVCPTGIEGRMINDIAAQLGEEIKIGAVSRQSIKRLATPKDVAQMMVFLLSDESQLCTGGCYNVDGGYST